MSRRYRVKEVFATLQGEGFHNGRAAVFVRLTACNLWSGQAADRAADAERHGAVCPLFCDTDFVGGASVTAGSLAANCRELGAGPLMPIVLTGGEPLLQLDIELATALSAVAPLHVETNGTTAYRDGVAALVAWTCISPKQAPGRLKLTTCDEIKVVVPAYAPALYEAAIEARHRYVQAEDGPTQAAAYAEAIAFVLANPQWRLSVQAHKVIGVR